MHFIIESEFGCINTKILGTPCIINSRLVLFIVFDLISIPSISCEWEITTRTAVHGHESCFLHFLQGKIKEEPALEDSPLLVKVPIKKKGRPYCIKWSGLCLFGKHFVTFAKKHWNIDLFTWQIRFIYNDALHFRIQIQDRQQIRKLVKNYSAIYHSHF